LQLQLRGQVRCTTSFRNATVHLCPRRGRAFLVLTNLLFEVCRTLFETCPARIQSCDSRARFRETPVLQNGELGPLMHACCETFELLLERLNLRLQTWAVALQLCDFPSELHRVATHTFHIAPRCRHLLARLRGAVLLKLRLLSQLLGLLTRAIYLGPQGCSLSLEICELRANRR